MYAAVWFAEWCAGGNECGWEYEDEDDDMVRSLALGWLPGAHGQRWPNKMQRDHVEQRRERERGWRSRGDR